MSYSLVQYTNNAGGAVAAGAAIPFGTRTAAYGCGVQSCSPFVASLSGADTMTYNGKGYYDFSYNISAVATAAGLVTINLVADGATATPLYTASATATAAGDTVNISIPSYVIRLIQTCYGIPSTSLQVTSTTALTSFTSLASFKKCV